MGHRTTRPRRAPERNRPSLFFIVALLLGIALLVWAFVAVTMRQPPAREKQGRAPVAAQTAA